MLTAYGAEVVVTPDRGRARQPRVVLRRVRPARARDPRRVQAQPVLEPERSALATTRPPAPRSGATPTAGSRTSSRASARAARSPAPAGTCGGVGRRRAHHRRRPRGLGVLGRHRPPVPRRGRRRGLLADRLRPRRAARDHRGLRRRVVRDDPPARARGGPPRRRVERHGRASRRSRPRATLGPDDVDRGAAARRRPRLPRQDLQRQVDARPTASRRARDGHTVADCSPRKADRTSPDSCTRTRTTPCARPIDIMTQYGVSQLPVLSAEPPVVHRRGRRRRSTRRPARRTSSPAGEADRRGRRAGRRPAAAHRRRRAGGRARVGARDGRRAARHRRRQTRRRLTRARPARLPLGLTGRHHASEAPHHDRARRRTLQHPRHPRRARSPTRPPAPSSRRLPHLHLRAGRHRRPAQRLRVLARRQPHPHRARGAARRPRGRRPRLLVRVRASPPRTRCCAPCSPPATTS